jgi:hypothetical protein
MLLKKVSKETLTKLSPIIFTKTHLIHEKARGYWRTEEYGLKSLRDKPQAPNSDAKKRSDFLRNLP